MGRSHVAHNPFHLGHEAFVGHAVGFVNCNHLNCAQVALGGFHQVDQTKRRSNDDLDSLFDYFNLLAAVCPAVDGQHSHATVLANWPEHFGNLQSQLASRNQDEAVRLA